MDRESAIWAALAAGTAIGAGIIARKSAAAAWRRARHEEPPLNLDNEDASWRSILAWAAVSGFCVAFARVVGRGAATGAWRKALGRTPPSV
ncbi:DUF4235 domain-containing protein [Salinisphaera sp. T31B1]|uniref:DUF4235 domain-containing protein n=1 Tax=Salinisphaera sp. T31B1 TaxID=727963 RepID=UPI0033418D40